MVMEQAAKVEAKMESKASDDQSKARFSTQLYLSGAGNNYRYHLDHQYRTD